MRYELLNKGDTIQNGDQYFDDLGLQWVDCLPGSFGIKCDGAAYRRPIPDWQPIETAPRGGISILVGWWEDCFDSPIPEWKYVVVCWRTFDDESFWSTTDIVYSLTDSKLYEIPEKWHPLPHPPIEKSVN